MRPRISGFDISGRGFKPRDENPRIMSRWLARVDDLLYDGETVETEVVVGEGGVVVTTHRVLAFTPGGKGSNFESVDRPNVTDVERTTRGNFVYLTQAIKALIVGGVLLAAGQVVSLDSMVGGIELGTTGGMGLGGFLSLMQSLLNLLAMLDEIMTAAGALGLLLGVVILGAYALSRESLLVVAMAGDDDLELPATQADDSVAERLDRAVRAEGSSGADSPPDSEEDPVDYRVMISAPSVPTGFTWRSPAHGSLRSHGIRRSSTVAHSTTRSPFACTLAPRFGPHGAAVFSRAKPAQSAPAYPPRTREPQLPRAPTPLRWTRVPSGSAPTSCRASQGCISSWTRTDGSSTSGKPSTCVTACGPTPTRGQPASRRWSAVPSGWTSR